MATHAPRPLELGTTNARPAHPGFLVRRRRELFVAALVVLGALVAVIWLAGRNAERRALARMAPSARQGLYVETLRNAEALCEQARKEPELLGRCDDASAFLQMFPECDESCSAFVHAHRRAATR